MKSTAAAALAVFLLAAIAAPSMAEPGAASRAKPASAATAKPASPAKSAATSPVSAKWVFGQVAKTFAAVQSATYNATFTYPTSPTATSSLTIAATLQKPNQLQATISAGGKTADTVIVGPTKGYVVDNTGKRYASFDPQPTYDATLQAAGVSSFKMIDPFALEALQSGSQVFAPDTFDVSKMVPDPTMLKTRVNIDQLHHQPVYDVVQTITMPQGTIRVDAYINKTTFFPVELVQTVTETGGQALQLSNESFDTFTTSTTAADPSRFSYTPPAELAAYTAPSPDQGEKPLLAAGTAAPDFTVQASDGKSVKLSDYTGKVIVIDFWATWCGPCQMSLPGTDKVAAKYMPQGVVFLPICSWDQKSAFDPWVAKHKTMNMSFYFDPAGQGDNSIAGSLYNVSGIPTQYVIGKDGKIITSFVGYDPDESALTTALDKALAAT